MNDKNTPSGSGDNNQKGPKNRQSIIIFAVFMLASFLALNFIQNFMKDAGSKEISYNEFIEMLEEDKVEKVEDTGLTWEITPRTQPVENAEITYFTGKMEDEALLPLLKEKKVEITPYIQDTLSISEGTAKTHLLHIYRKCDVHDRQEFLDLFTNEAPQ